MAYQIAETCTMKVYDCTETSVSNGVFHQYSLTSCNIRNLMQHSVQGQAAPGTPQQLRCFHPGVDQDDQLYLPSAPGTPKPSAPPQSWV